MKYFVTGNSGVGKSTVIEALVERGLTAYDTDALREVTKLEDLTTQAPVEEWPAYPIDWDRYQWNWQEDALKELLASDKDVFVGASVSNQERFYELFDVIFVLTIDEDTLRHRVLTRTNNDYGKHPDQLREVLAYNKVFNGRLRTAGAVEIDATQPIDLVVDAILSRPGQRLSGGED